ncbi:hypothetical protein Tco_0224855, partial [Tanacetum coccineum]
LELQQPQEELDIQEVQQVLQE